MIQPVAVAAGPTKVDASCSLLKVSDVAATHVKAIDYGFNFGTTDCPRADLSQCVLDNAAQVLRSVFREVRVVDPLREPAKSDLYAKAVVLHAKASTAHTAFSEVTFSADVALLFLDRNKSLILDVDAQGVAASGAGTTLAVKNRAVQRAFDAVNNGMTKIAVELKRRSDARFLLSHVDYFAEDEQAMVRHLDAVYPRNRREGEIDAMLAAYSVRAGHMELLKALLSRGVSPDSIQGLNRLPLLHWAALSKNLKAVEILIEAGADREETDALGRKYTYLLPR